MRKLLLALLVAVGLVTNAGCYAVIYDEPVHTTYAVPADGVLVGPGLYYRVVVVDGVAHRFYYRYSARRGWYYQNRVRVVVR